MAKVSSALKHLLRELVPVWLYFFASFALLIFTSQLRYGLRQTRTADYSLALVGSLIVAKVLLITDHFRFIERYQGRPLVYATLWKSAIYTFASVALRYLEELIKHLTQGAHWSQANREQLSALSQPAFWAGHVWLVILILVFCATRELSRAIGADRVRELFFGPGKTPPPRHRQAA